MRDRRVVYCGDAFYGVKGRWQRKKRAKTGPPSIERPVRFECVPRRLEWMCVAPYIVGMKKTMRTLDRREFVVGGAAVATVTALAVGEAMAQAAAQGWEEAVKKVLGGAKATEGKLTMDLPEIAENGNTVPFSISVDSPMTDKEYVKTVHVISTGNPQPGVATFRFTPQCIY